VNEFKSTVDPVAMLPPFKNHSKLGVNVSSGSVTVTVHSRMVSLVKNPLDVMFRLDNDGAVLLTTTRSLPEVDAPFESVTEAVHTTESPTLVSLDDTVYVEPVPTLEPLTVQVYVGDSVPSSKSDADAAQVSRLPVTTVLLGEIETLETTGEEFPTETTEEVLFTTAPLASVALAVHEIESLGDTIELVSCQVAPVLVEPLEAVQA